VDRKGNRLIDGMSQHKIDSCFISMCFVYRYRLLMFILLLMQCIYTYTHISQGGWTALRLAAQKGHEDIVELLLEAKADPEVKSKVIPY